MWNSSAVFLLLPYNSAWILEDGELDLDFVVDAVLEEDFLDATLVCFWPQQERISYAVERCIVDGHVATASSKKYANTLPE
jgi:hypothetical protein